MPRALISFFAIIVLSLVAVLPASAAGMWVSPSGGDYDTTFTAHASGFVPGERVDTWVNKPYQWRVGQGQYTADDNGEIEFDFRPDVTWGTGGFFASAEGLSSGRTSAADFSIGGGGYPLSPCGCRAVFLGDPGGTAVNYNAQGYGSSEIVVVYMTDPSAQIHRLPNAQADPWGNLAFPVYLSQDSLYGPYLFTARGLTTGRESYNTFYFWGGLRNHRSSNPISFATPTVTVQGGGFQPGEKIVVRRIASAGAVNIDLNAHADAQGNFQYNYIIPPGTQFGEYALTAIGAVSKVQLYQAFRWDGEITLLP